MPWKKVGPMDQKLELIIDCKKSEFTRKSIAAKHGISRKTLYKWLRRYEASEIDGLKDRPRIPVHRPNQTSRETIALVIEEKLKNRHRGPNKIHFQLQRKHPQLKIPAVSTIGHWLKKNGLVEARRHRKKVPPYSEPFAQITAPNDVWSMDYKGQFYTRDARVCYPLTISDNYSRYLLKCIALPGPRYSPTREQCESAFREFGLPQAIRSDNGVPFAGQCVGGLSRLSIWWIKLGICPERIAKGCPEQNGRHERMHRTLKLECVDPAIANLKEQQKRFDVFVRDYNCERPHESLNDQPPANFYAKSARPFPEKLPPVAYDYGVAVRSVRRNGYFKFNGRMYYLTELLHKERVALKEFADGLWKIYFSFYPLAILDLRTNKVLKLSQHKKVSPMSPV